VEVILGKHGNSTVAVLPPAAPKHLGLSAGQAMSLDTTAQGQIVLSRKRSPVLADMIAQCNRKAPPPADLALWNTAQPWFLDLAARRARRIERAPQAVIDEALGRLIALLDC